jgi:hypothetical protein
MAEIGLWTLDEEVPVVLETQQPDGTWQEFLILTAGRLRRFVGRGRYTGAHARARRASDGAPVRVNPRPSVGPLVALL